MKFPTLVALLTASLAQTAHAACDARQQDVVLYHGSTQLAKWVAAVRTVQQVKLPNGFNLALSIEPAAADVVAKEKKASGGAKVPDLVKIELYEARPGAKLRHLSRTWGGANSKQGFGPQGGANRVDEVGRPGILLVLSQGKCR